MSRGFAVVDLETTGLFPEKHDRIVEIAIVHVSPDGTVEEAWETLVNPRRDMGAQSIHGISAAAASHAPDFASIAVVVGDLLRGRVPVAHNASFDQRFLSAALNEVGEWRPDAAQWMCTMRLADTFLPGHRSLDACSAAIGWTIDDAHRASADALATAALLRAYIGCGDDRAWWDAWLASPAPWPHPHRTPFGWRAREACDVAPRSVIQRLNVQVEPTAASDRWNLDYLALLDRVLLDRFMSHTELMICSVSRTNWAWGTPM